MSSIEETYRKMHEALRPEADAGQQDGAENSHNEGGEDLDSQPEQRPLAEVEPEQNPGAADESKPLEPVIPDGYIPAAEVEKYKSEVERFKSEFGLLENDPILKELWELRKKNIAITPELLQEGYRDYSKVDTDNIEQAKNILRQDLIANGYSEREAFLAVKKQYRELHENEADEESEDYQAEEFAIKRAAKELIEKKKANQVRLKEIQSPSTNKDEIIKQYENEQRQILANNTKQLESDARDMLGRHKKVSYKFTQGDGDDKVDIAFDVEITKDMKVQLEKDLQNPSLAYAIYQTLDRTQPVAVQEQQLIQKALWFRHGELVSELRSEQVAAARVKDLVNKKIKHTQQPVGTESPDGIDYSQHPKYGKIAKAMAADRSKAA